MLLLLAYKPRSSPGKRKNKCPVKIWQIQTGGKQKLERKSVERIRKCHPARFKRDVKQRLPRFPISIFTSPQILSLHVELQTSLSPWMSAGISTARFTQPAEFRLTQPNCYPQDTLRYKLATPLTQHAIVCSLVWRSRPEKWLNPRTWVSARVWRRSMGLIASISKGGGDSKVGLRVQLRS